MRYAVLSDIHANLEAFAAVLDALAAERIDRVLCLGDVVGYGADPSACLARLAACPAVSVGGNHDLACIGKLDLGWFNDLARASLVWTRDQLGFLELDQLRRLPLTATEGPCSLVHGTLRHPQRFEYLVDLAQAIESLSMCRTLFCLAGHTHVPCFLEYDRNARRLTRILTRSEELAEARFEADADRFRYLLNPGSVGQPRDGDPRASAAILDLAAGTVRLLRVPYDVAGAQRKIQAAGLPGFLADRLAAGR